MLKPKENWGTSRRLSWVLQQESVSWNDVLDNIGQPKQTPATSSTVSSSGETSPMSSPTGCRPPRSKVSPVGSQEPFLLRNAQDQFRRAIDAHKLDGSPETRSQALPPTVNRSATYPPAQRTHQESFWGYQQTFDDDETCRSSSSLPAMSRDDSSTLLDVMVDVGGRASTENQTSREFFNTIGKLDAPPRERSPPSPSPNYRDEERTATDQGCDGWESRDVPPRPSDEPTLSPSLARRGLASCRSAPDEEAALLATAERRMPRVMAELHRGVESGLCTGAQLSCNLPGEAPLHMWVGEVWSGQPFRRDILCN